jgi:phosphate transport system substrate-binding protein
MNLTDSTRKLSTLLCTAIALFTVACGGSERTASEKNTSASSSKPLTVKGSDTMVILTQRLAEEYMKATPGKVVQITGGGSGTGIAALINGTTDVAQASRSMKDEERSKATAQRKSPLVETPIALDSLAVFVNEANPVKELTIDQIAAIYTGKVKNWSEVGGPNAPLVLYGRESSSGTYDYFKEHVLNKADFAPIVQTLQGTAAIINAVAKDKNGIGYGGIAYAKEVRAIGIRKEANGVAIVPSEATVADGTYPLSRKLFLYSFENSSQNAKDFIAYCLTPVAQELVKNVGYFPLSDTAMPNASPAATSSATSPTSSH